MIFKLLNINSVEEGIIESHHVQTGGPYDDHVIMNLPDRFVLTTGFNNPMTILDSNLYEVFEEK